MTLIVVSIITVKISDLILDSRIGALDRTLGFVFGAARGLLICVIAWVFFAWLAQGKHAGVGRRTRSPADAREHRQLARSPCCPTIPEGLLKQLEKPQPDGEPPSRRRRVRDRRADPPRRRRATDSGAGDSRRKPWE